MAPHRRAARLLQRRVLPDQLEVVACTCRNANRCRAAPGAVSTPGTAADRAAERASACAVAWSRPLSRGPALGAASSFGTADERAAERTKACAVARRRRRAGSGAIQGVHRRPPATSTAGGPLSRQWALLALPTNGQLSPPPHVPLPGRSGNRCHAASRAVSPPGTAADPTAERSRAWPLPGRRVDRCCAALRAVNSLSTADERAAERTTANAVARPPRRPLPHCSQGSEHFRGTELSRCCR